MVFFLCPAVRLGLSPCTKRAAEPGLSVGVVFRGHHETPRRSGPVRATDREEQPEQHSEKGPENDRQRRHLRAAAKRAGWLLPINRSHHAGRASLAGLRGFRAESRNGAGVLGERLEVGSEAGRSGVKRRGKHRSQASTTGESLCAGRVGRRRPRRAVRAAPAATSIVTGAARPEPDSAVCPRPRSGKTG